MAVTAADFKTRFPQFADVADARVVKCLNDASSQVDDTWEEADRIRGQLLFTAHTLILEGAIDNGSPNVLADRQIINDKIGDASTSFKTVSDDNHLLSTTFGIEYSRLLKQNQYGPILG